MAVSKIKGEIQVITVPQCRWVTFEVATQQNSSGFSIVAGQDVMLDIIHYFINAGSFCCFSRILSISGSLCCKALKLVFAYGRLDKASALPF